MNIGTQKTLLVPPAFVANQVLPAAGALLSSTKINVADYTSARIYFGYIALNASSQMSVQVKVSARPAGIMFNVGAPLLTEVGATSKFLFIDVDISNVCEIQATFQEVGNIGTPGTVNSSLMLSHAGGE